MVEDSDQGLVSYLNLISPAPDGFVRTLDGELFLLPHSMSLAEFDLLCKRVLELPEGPHLELHRGQPFVHPRPSIEHQMARGEMMHFIHRWILTQQFEDRLAVYGTDLRSKALRSYYTADAVVVPVQLAGQNSSYLPEGVIPPLVVEVLSDSTADIDFGIKRECYADMGIPEYWIVDPKTGAITLYTLVKGAYEQLSVDPKGFIKSPLLKRKLRIVVKPWTFEILEA